jgi:hypothetical protein
LPRYAEIKNNRIVNVIVADQDFIDAHQPDAIECPEFVGVGDKYEDGEFSRIVVVVEDEPLP